MFDKDILLENSLKKAHLLFRIKTVATNAMHINSPELIIYYTGHALKGSGAWVTYDNERITLEEII